METNLKLCKVCKSSIHIDAQKCIECDSFQNWRRHLNFGNNLLALLIAFISVLTVAFPVITSSLKSSNSDLVFTPIQGIYRNITQKEALKLKGEGGIVPTDTIKHSSGFFIQTIATNNGKKAGVVSKIEVWGLKSSTPGLENSWLDFAIIGERFAGSILINPNETKIITAFYHQDDRSSNDLDLNNSERDLKLRVTYVDNNGTERTDELNKKLNWRMDLPEL